MATRITRTGLLRTGKRIRGPLGKLLARFARDETRSYDRLSPGWRRARYHTVVLGKPGPNGTNVDLVTELPGRVFVRGWDATGAITRKRHP